MAKAPSAPPPRPKLKGDKRPPAPKPRPKLADSDAAGAVERGNRASRYEAEDYMAHGKPKKKMAGGKVKKMAYGGKVKKMAMGGKTRGCGAATKGTKYNRAG